HINVSYLPAMPPACNTPPNVLSDAQAMADARPPTGGLFGGLTIINVGSGTDYTADAVALANFYQSGSNYYPAGFVLPHPTPATPPVSVVHGADGRLYESTWAPGTADAVSAVLMHDSIANEYVLDTGTRSGTDWVMTYPTKRYYVLPGT